MKKFAIVCKNDDKSRELAVKINEGLATNGLDYDEKEPDIVCVVGGDGTFLSAIHKYLNVIDNVCFTGIHTGTLGYFNEFKTGDLDEYINVLVHNTPVIEEKRLLRIDTVGKNKKSYLSVNEMRLESIRTQAIDVYFNNDLFEQFRGSGLCVCTQVGSTAYNRSLKGAVIGPGLELLEMTEITGIHHSQCHSLGVPIVLSGDTTITLCSDGFKGVNLCFDRYSIVLDDEKKVNCYLSDKKMRIAHYKKVDWTKNVEQLF